MKIELTTTLQKEVLVGILLGDAHLKINRRRDKASLVVLQGESHKDYLFYLHQIFKDITKSSPKSYSFSDKRFPGKRYSRWSFRTGFLESLMPYADMFYDSKNKKRVPLEIEKLLSERAIAFWYIDDSAAKWKDKVKAVRFCTDSFSEDDVLKLIDVLKNRFNIVGKLYKETPRSSVNALHLQDNNRSSLEEKRFKTKHRISIGASEWDFFTKLVFKHMHPSMVHKYPKDKEMLEEKALLR